ncbi:hypothetical protein BKA14_008008 [Actinoplanes abujensis]|uniref:Uncharacterized protein n=1 Tax=Paractinoplanes abujensis TaxID=882441 RepID=A0A7W7D023_9ACTN|nr:hypothetical protein [Actinoplanes abujensis]
MIPGTDQGVTPQGVTWPINQDHGGTRAPESDETSCCLRTGSPDRSHRRHPGASSRARTAAAARPAPADTRFHHHCRSCGRLRVLRHHRAGLERHGVAEQSGPARQRDSTRQHGLVGQHSFVRWRGLFCCPGHAGRAVQPDRRHLGRPARRGRRTGAGAHARDRLDPVDPVANARDRRSRSGRRTGCFRPAVGRPLRRGRGPSNRRRPPAPPRPAPRLDQPGRAGPTRARSGAERRFARTSNGQLHARTSTERPAVASGRQTSTERHSPRTGGRRHRAQTSRERVRDLVAHSCARFGIHGARGGTRTGGRGARGYTGVAQLDARTRVVVAWDRAEAARCIARDCARTWAVARKCAPNDGLVASG